MFNRDVLVGTSKLRNTLYNGDITFGSYDLFTITRKERYKSKSLVRVFFNEVK